MRSDVLNKNSGDYQKDADGVMVTRVHATLANFTDGGGTSGSYATGVVIPKGAIVLNSMIDIAKETGASRNWTMADSLSQTAGNGGVTNSFQPNTNSAKDANERMDWLSNGFKLRTTSTTWNTSGGTYIYIAFAEHPFVSSKGVPTTAR